MLSYKELPKKIVPKIWEEKRNGIFLSKIALTYYEKKNPGKLSKFEAQGIKFVTILMFFKRVTGGFYIALEQLKWQLEQIIGI